MDISIVNTNISIINKIKKKSIPHTDEMHKSRKEKDFQILSFVIFNIANLSIKLKILILIFFCMKLIFLSSPGFQKLSLNDIFYAALFKQFLKLFSTK